MKKIVSLTFSLIIAFLFIFHGNPAFAQTGGTCVCTVGESRVCGLTANNCATGYKPTIANYSCTCVRDLTNCVINAVPTAGQACCSGYSPEASSGICIKTGNVDAQIGANEMTGAPPNTCSLLQGDAQKTCNGCMVDDKHVWTAIGCVEATSTGIVNKLLPLGVGMAGGIAFLLILFGALQMMMSAGNPEKLNAGKELVTSAITGLLLIIFSVFLLQLIGVKILKIPGFI